MKLWHRYRTLTWSGPIEVAGDSPRVVAQVFGNLGIRVTMLREVSADRMASAIAIIAEETIDEPTVLYSGIARPDKRRSKTLTGVAVSTVAVPMDANMATWIDHECQRLNCSRADAIRTAILASMHGA